MQVLPKGKGAWMRLGVLILGPVGVTWAALFWMTSFPTPGATEAVDIPEGLAHALQAHVEVLATDIGDRNAYVDGSLERAAAYIEEQASARGLALRRQSFNADSYDFANLHGKIGS